MPDESNLPPSDACDDLARRLTKLHVLTLRELPADAVVNAAMLAALNVALETMPYSEVSAWLRRLADTIDADDPAAPGRQQ